MKTKTGDSLKGIACQMLIILGLLLIPAISQEVNPIKLSWLGGKSPMLSSGVSWGVPFPVGKIDPASTYSLKNEQGQDMPVQSWPLAYWPDGSLKWVGFSTVVDSNAGKTFELQPLDESATKPVETKMEVSERADAIMINSGIIQCEVPKKGSQIIRSMAIDGKQVSSSGRLICILQDGPSQQSGMQPTREKYIGYIEKVIVEQEGPVRAVLKIEGHHVAEPGARSWLPFIVRLYFYAGQQSVRMVHTIIYDGDQEKDFIRGLGLVFDVPLDEQVYNRHIRFSGENGRLWDESCQPLTGRLSFSDNQPEKDLDRLSSYAGKKSNLYATQLAGQRISEPDSFSERQQFLHDNWASWDDFKLQQLNADGFQIFKRTNDVSSWIEAGWGRRSDGLAFVGDVSGGLTVAMRDFWQSFPSALEVTDVRSDTAQLKTWLWSPAAEAMDMGHYDTLAWGHTLDASYEDVQPGFSIATGVGRTTEIMLYLSTGVPSFHTLSEMVQQSDQPPLLTASPQYMHSIPVFGFWSLPDRSTKGKRWLEDQLDKAFKYYQQEVETRHWYGFWHYGDIRHAYDWDRHVWRYDVGGYAWMNAELVPNMWLWYSFLRSGRQDIFRMAEAMTRHTGEVDVHHLGRFKGLGSRHNVIHWGGGAKEIRISQAALGRFYYYLTTDERTGDLMRAVVESANEAIGKLDPMRLIYEKSAYPTHARVGPDWLALVGNWMTEWERTNDTRYRDRIMVGVKNLYDMPYGFYSGVRMTMGYDPESYTLYQLDEKHIGYSIISILMGGSEVAFELTPLLQDEKWNALWLQFCKLHGAPQSFTEKEFGRDVKLGANSPLYARIPAYYAQAKGDTSYAARAWKEFFNASSSGSKTNFNLHKFSGIESLQDVYEIGDPIMYTTNNSVQWCLNAIQLLEMIGDQFPEDNPRLKDVK
jgi:hypothetical protein